MRRHLNFSLQALRSWSARRWAGAAVATFVVALALGVVTVLIPNPIFLLAVGLVFRLSGSIACAVPQRRRASVAQPS